jgi:transposase
MTTDETTPARPKPPRRKRAELTSEEQTRILELNAGGAGSREVAKRLAIGRHVVRRLLEAQDLTTIRAGRAASKLDPFREAIREKAQKGLTVERIFREIGEQGYAGGRTILRLYVRSVRAPQAPRKKAWRRFETAPGEEQHVDWSPYTVLLGGAQRRVQAFLALLAWSRKAHVRFYEDQRQSTLLEASERAFEDFEGVAQRYVLDFMATAVLARVGPDGQPLWHPRFADFVAHFGTTPYLCRAADPDRKGKGERFFWFLEQDFVRGGSWASLLEMNEAVRRWLDAVANSRVHGTTGRVPDEAWREEKPYLIALPGARFAAAREELRLIGPAPVISVKGTRYSVPAALAHQTVSVRLHAERFEVIDREGRVAFAREYVPPAEKGRLVIDESHYAAIDRGPRPTARPRADGVLLARFPDLSALVDGIRQRMKSLAHVHLNALVRLAERYGDDAFLVAAHTAQQHRRFDWHAVARLLERACPQLEDAIPPVGDAARVLVELGDVDSGSLDDYAALDGASTSPEVEDSDGR